MTKKTLILLVITLLGLLSVAASCEGEKIKEGFGQEYISFVEEQNNGIFQLWLRYDNIASYCFESEELHEKALWFIDHYPDGISRLHYLGIMKDDPLYERWYESGDQGCATFGGSSDGGGTEALRMVDFCIMEPVKVLGEDTPLEYYCETVPQYLLPEQPNS